MSITQEELVLAFQVAIDSRKKNYANTFAYHFHWQNDNSGADKDAETFVQLATLLGFETPETDIIPNDAATPGFDLTYKIGLLLKFAHQKPGSSIVLLHYSGHAVANQNNELVLTSRTGKQIAADRIMADLCSEFIIPLDANVDVVVILDCCHSYLFTPTANEGHRRVDVLSAGNREDPKAYGSRDTLSFTSKLSVEIQKRAQRGDVEIEMADLVSSLGETSSPVKTPTYAARLGLGSVVLPIIRRTPTASTTIPQDTSAFYPSGYLVTFSLHVAETLSRSEIDEILHWIHQAPKKETSDVETGECKENKLDAYHC